MTTRDLEALMPTKGPFATLFDFRFTSLITTRIVRLVYALSVACVVLAAAAVTVAAFAISATLGAIVLLVVAPMSALVWIIWIRVGLEFCIALFRVVENTQALVQLARGDAP